jgi:hypothetical protein
MSPGASTPGNGRPHPDVLLDQISATAELEGELGLLFYLTPENRGDLLAQLTEFATRPSHGGSLPAPRYRSLDFDRDQLLSRMDDLERGPGQELGLIWSLRIRQLREMLGLLLARGSTQFTGEAERIYGVPDAPLVEWAEAILRAPEEECDRIVAEVRSVSDESWPAAPPAPAQDETDADGAAAYMEEVIRFYGLQGVDTAVSDQLTARAMVEGGRLWLSRDATFTSAFMERLAVHEVGVHLRRRARRPAGTHPLLEMESPHGPGTEEGLTVLAEARAGCLDPEVLRTYAGRVLVIRAARDGGAIQVIESLRDRDFEPDVMATLVLRAKRGTADFSGPGVFPKDLCYLEGARSVLEFTRAGGNVSPLFDCMLALEDLPYLPEGILSLDAEGTLAGDV